MWYIHLGMIAVWFASILIIPMNIISWASIIDTTWKRCPWRLETTGLPRQTLYDTEIVLSLDSAKMHCQNWEFLIENPWEWKPCYIGWKLSQSCNCRPIDVWSRDHRPVLIWDGILSACEQLQSWNIIPILTPIFPHKKSLFVMRQDH